MEIEEIRKLIRLMEEAGLLELEIEDRSGKVRLVRGRRPAGSSRRSADDGGGQAYDDLDDAGRDVSGTGETGDGSSGERVAPGSIAVTSPMVGTFYRAPAPDAVPFVNVGDVVQAGQVLCIIEAMKMMNEIHAETAGRVIGVLAENGASVEYGSPLFLLELLE
jgi:acetyl-CoA carboxylase biotin carboxyl carrier protein